MEERRSVADGKNFIGHLNPEGVNQDLVESGFPRTSFAVYREYWRDQYERLKDASSQEAMNEVRNEVVQTTMTLSDDPPLSGPIMLTGVAAQAAEFERFREHWSFNENGVNWTNFKMVKISASAGADYQAGVSDRVEHDIGIPDTVDSPPEHIMELFIESGAGFGDNIMFNYGGEMDDWSGFDPSTPPADKTAGKRQAKVRQAMAWAFDSQQIAQNNLGPYGGKFTTVIDRPLLGLGSTFERTYPDLYEAVPSGMVSSANPEKAKEALRASGLSEENGTWVKPDGSPLTVQIESFPWSRDLLETAVQNLKDVNVQAEHIVQEGSVLFSRLGGGDFAAAQSWIGLADPLAAVATAELRRGWPMAYQPNKWKVPPVGEYDAAPTETFDAKKLASKLQTTSFEEHKEELKKLHWIGAYHLPGVPLYSTPSRTGWNNRHFKFPKHPPRSSGENGRISAPGDASKAASVYGVGQPFRMVRRALPQPNGPMARK